MQSVSISTKAVSSNPVHRHDITEILLKVALNTINATPTIQCSDKACMVFILYSMALAEINSLLAKDLV